eukprot:Blabericola_migrator_1__5689@NODE_2889_length_2236_cov_111_839557_g1813_i0_p2_GENE_NODE_2889_length_2236_cov_111_839557_g1813_i0NODE_2889_length_2236_cov_111_839557_g1813_i0_p2_ORF_typecomplete_len146_score13_74Tudorknot/PF11717_8/1_1e07_NODE_2889_length_2236_cov_111_839557_g1813_i06321069
MPSSRGRKTLPASPDTPGSPVRYHVNESVWAWHEEANCWRRAIIVATERPAAILPRDEANREATDKEAYIHWEGFDRRLDRWIQYKWIAKRSAENSLKGKVSYSDEEPDDSHAGLDADYLKEHQEQTKFKTINKVALGRYLVDCW